MSFQPGATAGGGTVDVGTIISYVEFTSNVTVSGTTDATANVVVTAAAFTADGFTQVWVDFYAAGLWPGATTGSQLTVVVWDNATSLGLIADTDVVASSQMIVPCFVRRKVTPTAGVHTYSIRAFRVTSNGLVAAGAGGAGAYPPGYICITKAA